VRITIETCNPTTRDAGGGSGAGSPTAAAAALPQVPQGKYSFIHKVVDGITIVVNTVNVNFVSAAFTASVQMSRIRVESKTPKWANADLRLTRLKDAQKGIILILGGGKVGDKRKAFYNPDEAATIFCTCLEVEKVCGLT